MAKPPRLMRATPSSAPFIPSSSIPYNLPCYPLTQPFYSLSATPLWLLHLHI